MSFIVEASSNNTDRRRWNCAEFASVEAGQRQGRQRAARPSWIYYAQFEQLLPIEPVGPMVKRKKTSPTSEEHEICMTPGSREGIGVDGTANPSRKADDCDDEEEESGEQATEERSTKGDERVEILNPAPATLSPGSAQPGPGLSQQTQPSVEPSTPCHDQHHFLRSSVRPPSKRIRKDSIGSAINGHGGAKSKGAENGSSSQGAVGQSGPVAGSSGGVSKNAKGQGPAEKEEQAGNQKRARRQWESWSAEDKNSFFEGLYEHGKDFEAIQNNIAMKYKKRGKPANMVKNKEQVRHFYYRTWHKISKHIDFANVYTRVLKKSSQELYGLICYAELRKKVGGLMDDKNVVKLNELIQQGATTVRSKGRNLRIKAPMCRALKKLCDPDGVSDEEDQKPVRLPLKVAVELQPRSNYSWARVQSLAHNPRLRMVVELHRKVSSLIEYLKQKWAYHDQRIIKSLMEREALEGTPCDAASSKAPPEELFLFPAESSSLTTLPGVARVVHSKASCTVHWQESGKARPNAKELPAAAAQILGIHTAPPSRTGTKSGRGNAAATAWATPPSDACQTEPPPSLEVTSEGSAKAEEKRPSSLAALARQVVIPREEANGGGLVEGSKTSAPTLESGGGQAGTKTTEASLSGADDSLEPCKEEPSGNPASSSDAKLSAAVPEDGAPQSSPPAVKERTVEQIRGEGWNVRDAENVTLAELYLMFGKPGKLQLEYEWQAGSRPHEKGRAPSQLRAYGKQRVLRCLLRLVTTEVNPKPLAPELCSTATSPLKASQDDQNQALTPPGKGPLPGVRSPGFGRQPASVRGAKFHLPNVGGSGARNLARSLLGSSGAAAGDSEGNVFAVPTTLPPNSSRHSRIFSPNKEAELALRQQLDSISMQSDLFLSRPRKPRNKLRKPLVVQRTLLPQITGDTSQHFCSLSILSNSSATGTGSFRPIQTRLAPACLPLPSKASSSAGAGQLSGAIDLAAKTAGIIPGSPCREPDSPAPVAPTPIVDPEPDSQLLQHNVSENGLPPPSPGVTGGGDSLLSPPSVASLLDISLPGPPEEALTPGENQTHISDSIIELAINSAHYGEEAALSSAKLSSGDGSKLLASSPSVSPSRGWIPSPSHDPQWYPSDSSDSTLGCLLSSMVSSEKGRRSTLTPSGPSSGTALLGPSLLDCNSHDSFQSRGLPDVAEMDSQLACMMSESSVDYIARFNDLAQELAVAEPSIPPP
ncbi:protein cramped-like [Hippocampus zosterae]|uniref:protein cramped-like n=1 Tax=Hippocampus zosterae TaxID=109293 RepID=UPI00223D2919|nr:protein cramped-like [Hippocampus zosterae]